MNMDFFRRNYREVVFWPQGLYDADYLRTLTDDSSIRVLPATVDAYEAFLMAVVKGAKPGVISRLLLTAEAKRAEMEQALAQGGPLRVPAAAR